LLSPLFAVVVTVVIVELLEAVVVERTLNRLLNQRPLLGVLLVSEVAALLPALQFLRRT
jgi:hypothetical protein